MSNWVSGSDKFTANAITGNPAKNTMNVVPLNQVELSPSSASRTLWTSALEITMGATIKVQQITTGGFAGPFSFAQTNLASAPGNITTTTAASAAPASPTAIAVTTLGTAVTLTDTPVLGYPLTGASCTDANSSATGNTGSTFATLAGNVLTIPANNVKAGADFTCVFTSDYRVGTYWDGPAANTTSVEGGTGTWTAAGLNWTTSTGTPNGNWNTGNTAIFGVTTGVSTVTVSGTQNINGLTFNTTGYTLTGGTLSTTAATTFTADPGVSATVNSVISGANTLTKAGAGTITLGSLNTYTGATAVNAGTLVGYSDNLVANGGAFGTTSSVTVNSGGTLQAGGNNGLFGFDRTTWPGVTINASGTMTTANLITNQIGGALTLAGGTLASGTPNATWGSWDFRPGASITSTANSTISATNMSLVIPSLDMTVNAGVSLGVSGSFVGVGAMVKKGTGTLTFSGVNTYTGATTVSAGNLTLGINSALASASATTVASGATLGVNGKSQTLASLTSSGTLDLGVNGSLTLTGNSSIGAITGSGTITVNSGATLTLTSALSNANVNIVLAGGTLNLGVLAHSMGTLTVSANSTLDFASAGTAQLTASTLAMTASRTLNVTNWTRGTDKFYATAFTGAARNTIGVVPMNQITLTGYAAALTVWQSDNEINVMLNPRVRIAKTSNGGVGTFNFTLSGFSATADSITTATSGLTVLGTAGITGVSGQAATIAENPPTGWPAAPASASCLDANGATDGNGAGTLGTLSGATLTLPAAIMIAGADITCTFVNRLNGLSGYVFNDGGAPSAGVNSGTPNDGVKNGSEAGLGGVAVTLTDCAATTHASTATDSNGAWALNVPASVAAGTTVCVTAGAPSGYTATGASSGSTAVPDGSTVSVGAIAYTYSRASQRMSFAAPAGGSAQMSFGEVPASTFVANGARQGAPSTSVVYPHTFKAGTGGSLVFSVTGESATPANPSATWSGLIYADPGCTNTLQSGAAQLYPTVATTTVVQGDVVCVVLKEQIPSNADNATVNQTTVRAALSFGTANPGLSVNYTVVDSTTVSNAVLELTKEVRNVTTGGAWSASNEAKSGQVLEYRVKYLNNGASPMTQVVFNDTVPAYTSFESASVSGTPSALGNCTKNTPANEPPLPAVACTATQAVGGTGNLRWVFDGTLNPGSTGEVSFQVRVN